MGAEQLHADGETGGGGGDAAGGGDAGDTGEVGCHSVDVV